MTEILAELRGNEEQVARATKIRAAYISSMQTRIAEILKPVQWPDQSDETLSKLESTLNQALFAIVSYYTSASWWIERQDRLKSELSLDWELAMSVIFESESKHVS